MWVNLINASLSAGSKLAICMRKKEQLIQSIYFIILYTLKLKKQQNVKTNHYAVSNSLKLFMLTQ